MKKYNITINVLFWILVTFMISVVAISVLLPDKGINSLLFGRKEKIVVEKEPVVITKVKKVEKEVDWFHFVATGYSANDSVQGTNNITATGKEVHEGIVAVDPKIIPLGTEIEIKGIGTFIAEDTGGKIKGNRIDIFFNSKDEAKKFGKKDIWVRILDNNIELAQISEK